MITNTMTRAERSNLHVAMCAALNVPLTRATTIEEQRKQAFCEMICWAGSPGDIYILAEAIDYYVVQALHGAEVSYVSIDATELRAELGAESVNLALKIAGIVARVSGRKTLWTNAPDSEPTLSVILPTDLLEKWYHQ